MFAPNKIWVAKIAAIFKCPCLNHSHLGVRYNYYTFYLLGGGDIFLILLGACMLCFVTPLPQKYDGRSFGSFLPLWKWNGFMHDSQTQFHYSFNNRLVYETLSMPYYDTTFNIQNKIKYTLCDNQWNLYIKINWFELSFRNNVKWLWSS